MKKLVKPQIILRHNNSISLLCFFVICSFSLISCQLKNDESITTFSSFDKHYNLDHGEYFKHDLIGFYDISIIDSFLVLCHKYKPEDKLLYIYNAKGQLIRSAVSLGKGPNEIGRLGFGFTTDQSAKQLYFTDYSKNVIFRLDFYGLLYDEHFEMKKEIFLKPEIVDNYSFAPLGNDKYVYCGKHGNHLLGIFNKGGIVENYIGERFVEQKPEWIDQDYSEAYRVFLAVNPERNRIAAAYRYFDRLEIYNINGKKLSTTIGPLNMKESFVWKDGMRLNNPRPIPAFAQIKTTDKFIFCSFPAADSETRHNKVINVYNWHGKPIADITFDQEFSYFGLDAKKGLIYTNPVYTDMPILYYKFDFNLLN